MKQTQVPLQDDIRDYNADTDLPAVARIWQECGWIDDAAKDKDKDTVSLFIDNAQHALVATMNGEAECAVIGSPGTLRYLDETLSMGAVAAVTTSHIARKQGFAGKLTARLLAKQVAAGHVISALGMFEQGFYDRLGFGSGAYEQMIRFDPATLIVDQPYRTPRRLTKDNAEAMYQAMLNRRMGHGSVTINSLDSFRGELALTENPYGLGYYDDQNLLTHFIWGSTKNEHGPYSITIRAHQNKTQLMELLALCKSLADQVNIIEMLEFGDVQMQDLLKQPFRNRRGAGRLGDHTQGSHNFAYWQARILDLPACLAKTHLNTPDLAFNLHLTDPVAAYLPTDASWRGTGGDYIVTLGNSCHAEVGENKKLPNLHCSVNTFTRLWLGVRPASDLTNTTDLKADRDLIQQLDRHLCLPRPHLGWDF